MPVTNQSSTLTANQIRAMRNQGLLQPISNLQRSGTPYDPFYGSTTGYGANPTGGGALYGSPSLFGYSGLGYVAPTLYQTYQSAPNPSATNSQYASNVFQIGPNGVTPVYRQQQQATQFDPYNTGLFGTPQQQSQLYQGTPPPTMNQITSGPTAGQPVTANALASYLGVNQSQPQQTVSSNPLLDSILNKVQASGQQIGSGGGGYTPTTQMPYPYPHPAPQPPPQPGGFYGPGGTPVGGTIEGVNGMLGQQQYYESGINNPMLGGGTPPPPGYLGPPTYVSPPGGATGITNTTRQQTGLPTNQAAPPRSQQAAYGDIQSIFENYNPYQQYQYPTQQQSSGFSGVQLGFSDPSGVVSGRVNGTLQSMQNTMDPAAFAQLTRRVGDMSSNDIAQWLTGVKKTSYKDVRSAADLQGMNDEDLQAWYADYQNALKTGQIADIFNTQEGRLTNLAENELRNRGLRNTVYSPTQVQDIGNKISQAPPWELAQFVQYQEGIKAQQPNWNAADEKLLTTAKQQLANLSNQISQQIPGAGNDEYPVYNPALGLGQGGVPLPNQGGQLGAGDPYLQQLYNQQFQFDPLSGLGDTGLLDIPEFPQLDVPDYTQGDIDFQNFLDQLNLGINVPPPGETNGGAGGGGGSPLAPGPLTSVGTPQIPVEPIYTQQQIGQQLQNALAGNATNYQTELLAAREGLGSRGFNTRSPAFLGANARAAANRAQADVSARRDIPIAMQQANARHVIEAMAENARQRGLDISTYTALINAQNGLLSPLLGALVGIL